MSNSNLKNKQNKLNINDLSGVEELDDAAIVAVNGGFSPVRAKIKLPPIEDPWYPPFPLS